MILFDNLFLTIIIILVLCGAAYLVVNGLVAWLVEEIMHLFGRSTGTDKEIKKPKDDDPVS